MNGVRKNEIIGWFLFIKLFYLDSVCSIHTCQNGGTCRQIAPTMAECLCQIGFTGPTCGLSESINQTKI